MDLSGHFDADAFEMLKDVMEDEFSGLLQVYIEDSDSRMPLIRSALMGQDSGTLRELAHSFKGASSNIGAMPLAKLCLTLETAAKDNQLEGLDQVVADIEQEYQQVKNFLQSHI